jgi:eukaryotic-like serine/threonine-protein kinase
MSDDTNRERELFSEALDLESPQARLDYLISACGPDHLLRQRVETLLKAYESATRFIPARSGSTGEILTVPPPFQPIDQPGEVIDRYTLLQSIGEGGFGTVYLAEQREPVQRRVALKVIKLGMDTRQVIARFESERQALALMDHPNIAKVLDAGATVSGRPYFVMELVQGVPITEYCDRNQLSRNARLELFMQVGRAVQHAHQKGVIHRDIKPSNIVVTLQDGMAMSKVIDFGIAKATQQPAQESVTQWQQFIGTPAYMSPEQTAPSSVDLDTRSDIYALGVLLYELLVGQPPFDSKELLELGVDEMRKTIREKEPLRPSTRLRQSRLAASNAGSSRGMPGVPSPPNHQSQIVDRRSQIDPDLDWIVMKCLEKDRARRYETANALVMDLHRYLHHEPVLARPPSAVYRFKKAVRRNRLAFAGVTAVTVMSLLGTAGILWQWRRAEQHRQSVEYQLYVAKMNLAQAAWEQGNVSRLRQLLDETAAAPERDFEWFYWQRQMRPELKTLSGHLGSVLAVAWSEDGRRIITGSTDRTGILWDADTNEELRPLTGHGDAISSAAFFPDGNRIVTGSWDHTARVWETASGRSLFTLSGHTDRILSVAVSPDGERIVTGSADHSAIVWNTSNGTSSFTLTGHTDAIFSVAFSKDCQRIATGSWDGTVRIWPLGGGEELLILTNDTSVSCVAFSTDGRQIAAGTLDSTTRIWDAVTGRELPMLVGHNAPVYSVAWSPGGERILTGSMDQTAKVWDATTGRALVTLLGHTAPIFSAAFSPDGKRIVTGSGEVAIIPDGNAFLFDDRPQPAKMWSAESRGSPVTLSAHSLGVISAAFSPDSRWIASGSWDGAAKLWETSSGKELLLLNGHTHAVHCVAFSHNGEQVLTGSLDGTAMLWDARNGVPLMRFQVQSPVSTVAFSPNDQRIITASARATVWDVKSGSELFSLNGHSNTLFGAFSPDGRRLLTGGDDGTARVWDAHTGDQLHLLKWHRRPIRGGAFSPDGRRIVLGSLDRTATVWDAISGKWLLTLKGHGLTVLSVGFSFDGKRIVTSSGDQTAKVWEARRGLELLTLKGHVGAVFSAAFSRDGQRVVTAGGDKTIKIWSAASSEQVARWREEEQLAAQPLEIHQPEH